MISDITLGRKVLTATSLECCQMYKSNILDGKRQTSYMSEISNRNKIFKTELFGLLFNSEIKKLCKYDNEKHLNTNTEEHKPL